MQACRHRLALAVDNAFLAPSLRSKNIRSRHRRVSAARGGAAAARGARMYVHVARGQRGSDAGLKRLGGCAPARCVQFSASLMSKHCPQQRHCVGARA